MCNAPKFCTIKCLIHFGLFLLRHPLYQSLAVQNLGKFVGFGIGIGLNTLLLELNIFLGQNASQSLIFLVLVKHNLELSYSHNICIQFLLLK